MTEQYISPHVPNDVPRMVNVDICGVSGRFPESSSASEFYQNLISGKDMVTDDERKWKHIMHEDMPKRCGKLKAGELASFDAQFFGMHGQQAKKTDPQLYKLLEVSYEAWTDSGIDVRGLRDSNRVGVYTGLCGSEVHGMYVNKKHAVTGYEQTGCVMSMMANRLSYFYSFRGPSKTCDTACSSAAMSLHDAIADISAGRTDYAVVLGSCHMLAPNMTLAFNRLHMLSPEGACKAFDAAGNGYVRSEGIAAVVLKRHNLADVPRWAAVSPYCTVLNIGINNDGFTKEGITFPSRHAQLALEKQVCQQAGVNPADIYYVEAHGTGTVAGDGQELDAINKWYGQAEGRKDPLWIGSVKSNMGHCEGCSCLASVVKLCLSFEYGVMPGQLHFHPETPNPDSEGLRDGTLKVMLESTPIDQGLVALSSFGFGGANMHMVMQSYSGDRMQLLSADTSSDDDSVEQPAQIDNIVPLASRTAEGLAYLAKVVGEAEEADGLSFAQPLRRYANSVASDLKLAHRGTLINGELKAGSSVGKAPEVYFVFSGNGSQWPKMGLDLIKTNAIFQRAIKTCHEVLKPYDIDLLAEFEAVKGFKTPLLNSVGLIAVQIGLVDVLKEEYGLVADGMIGHSAGEIACTYASGCCTAKQAVLIAYHRGRLPTERKLNTGLMAATGLSADEARERCEGTNVVLACDNSPQSTTISGPAEEVKALVKELDTEGIFARALDTNGVPYHSPQLDPLLKELESSLKEVIPSPKERPSGWLSAAFPLDSTLPEANLCSAGYQVHSYRNAVLFNDAAQAIPKDALLLEIGPHSVMRSPLRQARPDLGYVNSMRKGEPGVESLATCVGDLWRKGVPINWSVEKLPQNSAGSEVPRAVREALVAWDRTLYDIPVVANPVAPGFLYERLYDLGGEDEYICDHTIDHNVFIPMSCFVVTAWEAFAKQKEKSIWDCPVEFTDVHVFQPVSVKRGDKVLIQVAWDYSGNFQVIHDGHVIADGNLKEYDVENQLPKELPVRKDCAQIDKPDPVFLGGVDPDQFDHITRDHWYAMCLRQSLQYGPKFQMVSKYAVDRSWCDLRWDQNWIIHLDGVFQREDRGADYHVHVAKGLRRLVICDTMKDVESGYEERLESDFFLKQTRGRSIIVQNYLDEIASQKGKAAMTLVHKLEFLPYGLRTVTEEKRAAYTQKLTSLAKTLFKKLEGDDSTLHKMKAVIDKLPGKIMGNSAVEAFTSDENNLLAAIFAEAYDEEEGPSVNIIAEHSGLPKALEEDLFLNGFSQVQFDVLLGVAVGNMKAAGYSVAEIGAGTGAFTKKALHSFLTIPQSALLSYTATDKDATSGITKAVPHSSISYEKWDLDKQTAAPGQYNVVVANNLSASAIDLPEALAQLYENTLEGGFIFLQELVGPLGAAVFGYDQGAWQHTDGRAYGPVTTIEHWQELLSAAGFKEVSVVKDTIGSSALFLYRKLEVPQTRVVLLEAPTFHATEADMDAWLKNYLAALDSVDPTGTEEAGTVWLYGDSKNHPGLLGFLTSARKEYKGDRLRVVGAWGGDSDDYEVDYDALLQKSLDLDLVGNMYDGDIHGAYAPVQTEYKHKISEGDCPQGGHLNFETYGNLRSAVWRENVPVPVVEGEHANKIIRCDVVFGALNFRDVMLAYGKLSKQQMAHESGGDNIGFEFSGIEEGTGKRVMGSAKNAMATKIVTRRDLTWVVPDHWSLAEAATVPTAYMTAYYSIIMRGRLRAGHRVLIHSATGAVGLAAVQICLNRGAEVFVTVGTAEKRKFLLKTFPGLKENHIGDSRTLSFEQMIKNETRGKGVHLLLNSLAGDKLQASVRCLGNWGKLLEIGKYDILQGTPLSMRPMLNNISFEGIDVDRVMNHPDSTELEALNQLVTEGIASGEVLPLPVTVFNRSEIEEAFRYMASGVHIGKVMVDVTASPQPQETRNCLGASKKGQQANGQHSEIVLPPLKLEPSVYFDPRKSYIVAGGLGGFGLAICEFLNAFGAKNIVITSGRGVRDGNQMSHLMELYRGKINFRVTTLDVGVREEAEQIVELAESLGPVGGVFHLAMYLADKLITNQTGESWNKVMHAKAKGGYNLDAATAHCKELDHFVMWSSFVASAGNEGQTNYGYANACLDALSESRKSRGLPSLSVQWGVIDHVGVADKNIQELMAAGLLGASMAQPIDDCLKTLGRLMTCGPKQYPVMSSSWQPTDILGKSSAGESKNVLQAVLTVMGLTPNEVNDADTLSRLGIDSMQLVEVRSNLQRAIGRPLALDEASAMTIGDIKALEAGGDSGSESKQEKAAATPQDEETSASVQPKSAPIILPSKIIDLKKDLCVRKEVAGRFVKDYTVKPIKEDRTDSPPSAPSTPDKDEGSPTPRSPRGVDRNISSASLNDIKSHRLVTRSPSPAPAVVRKPSPITPINRTPRATAPPTPQGGTTPRGGSSPRGRSPAPAFTPRSGSPRAQSPTMRSHGSHEAVLPPASGTDSEYPYTWDDLTNQGFMFTVATLVLVWGWAISKAAVTGSQYGLLLSIPVVVLGYLAAGIGFTLITVILKRYLTIKIVFDEPIKLFSPQFAAWWLTNRFVEINHMLFMRNFRGTVILNYYYTLMGAKIAENAFVDTLDVVDFDSLEVGENTVIGEGTTVVGHTFDSNGDIVFKKIRIGEGVRVFPYSLITPDTVIRDGEELKPLAKTTTKLTSFNDQPGLEKVARTLVRSPDLTAAETTLYQIGGVTIPLLVSTVAAYVGCIMFEYFMAFLGTPVDFAPYYGVVAFVTLANPFLTIFALLMSPVAAFSLNGLVNAIPTVLASFIAVPQAFVAYAVTLVVLASFAKHLLIGKIEAGVHKRASVYGVSYWTSQRLVEITFNNVGSMVMGTWGLNSIYRMFGAQVEAFTVLRKTPAVTVPDMLKLGKWVVGGDTCKIATYLPLDQGTILSAPVVVEDQGTMGASAIILPGTTVQKQATLAPLTVSEAGSTLNASTIYIGAPATPIKLEQRPEAGVEIALPLQVLATLLPYIQIFGCLLFALASHIPAALVGHAIIAFSPGILGKFVATYVAVSIQSVVIGRLNNKLQDTVGRVEAGPGPTQWSLQYFVASANAAVTFFCACFGDCLWKGSPTWVKALRRSGLQIGKWVYLDSEWLGEPGLIEYGDRAVADRGAIVFGHLMTHNGKEFAIHFNKVNVGAGAIINARAAVMPGVQIQSGEHVPAGDLRISL